MDYIVRATAANNQIRAFAITSKDLVEEARKILKCEELTYKEAEKLEAYYQSLIDECNRTIKKLKKDMRISYGILKDIRSREQKETLRHDVAKQEKVTSRPDVAK